MRLPARRVGRCVVLARRGIAEGREGQRARLRRSLRHYGPAGLALHALTKARGRIVLRERHVWYALETSARRARPPPPEGLELRRGSSAGAHLVGALVNVDVRELARRAREDADLWLVLDGERAAFACWIYRESVPLLASPRGTLDLPTGTVCLEDSVTRPGDRGRGIAPAAWAAIADTLLAEGQEILITKVEEENAPVRRALAKVGFVAVAHMRFLRLGPRRRVSLTPSTALAGFLVEQLAA